MGQAAVQLSIAGNATSVWSESIEKTGSASCSAPWGELWSSGALFPPPGQSRFLNDKSRHTSAQDAALADAPWMGVQQHTSLQYLRCTLCYNGHGNRAKHRSFAKADSPRPQGTRMQILCSRRSNV